MSARPGLPVREDLRGQSPYGAPQLDVDVVLNTNENPFPPSAALVSDAAAEVAATVAGLNRYPDREASALRADLAAYLAVESGVSLTTAHLWPANGSNEIMQQLLQGFGGPGRSVLTFTPTYSMYPEYCRNTSTRYLTEPRDADFALPPGRAVELVLRHQPTVVLLSSPNNPTGTSLPLATVQAVLSVAPGLVVVDEAYAEFRRPGTRSSLELLADHPRLVVTRTMSKAFGLAGGRLGYAAAHPDVVDVLRVVRLPYHLSAVTQAVARVALRHRGALAEQCAQIRAERDAQVAWLREQGLRCADSDANFVLFGTFPDRRAVWQGLLERDVLIREVGPEGWLRVSIGTPAENERFRLALKEVLA